MFEPWWPCFQDGELCAVKIGQLLGTQLSRYFWSPLCRQRGYLGMGLRLMKHTEHVHIPEETLQCARKLRKSSQHIPTLCSKLWDWIKTWIHTCTIVERMNIHMPAILMILMILGFWCSHMIPSWFGTWIILNLGPARGTCDPPMLSKMMAISIPTSLGRTGPLGPGELDTHRDSEAGLLRSFIQVAKEWEICVCFWYWKINIFYQRMRAIQNENQNAAGYFPFLLFWNNV